MHRFFVSQPLTGELSVMLTDRGTVHQLARVLRHKPGDELVLLDGSGMECKAVIQSITKDAVHARVVSCAVNANEPSHTVTLYQSILKKDKMEWVFEKCTEAGVSRFVPVASAYAVKLGFHKERAQKIVKEAAEQSGRGRIPHIAEPMEFAGAVKEAAESDARTALAHNIGGHQDIQEALAEYSGAVNLFIGPEGGFSEEEVVLAEKNGFSVVSLGPRTLRAETAAVVASFLCAR